MESYGTGKKSFLDENAVSKPIMLSLGKIDDNDDTYVNGIWVGSTKNWVDGKSLSVFPPVFSKQEKIL